MNITFFTIQTPALLFPTVSLLMLAYTNRFLTIAQIVRSLKKHYDEKLSFYEAYKDMIEDKDKKLFESYMVFPKRNLLSRLVIIIMNNFSLGGNKLGLIVKTILRRPIQ